MKIILKNIGVMQKAEFDLGDLTIICGKNNTGKTYATYALYGFLHHWNDLHAHAMEYEYYFQRYHSYYQRYYSDDTLKKIFFKLESFKQLEKNGKCEIDISDCLKSMQSYIDDICKEYDEELSKIFASSEKYFEDSSFVASIGEQEIDFIKNLDFSIMDEIGFVSILKKRGNTKIELSLANKVEFEKFKNDIGEADFEMRYGATIDCSIAKKILFSLFPKPFIASAERTGVAIFKSELNIARNKLLRKMSSTEDDADLVDLYRKNSSKYALPIDENVDFTEAFRVITKQASFIAKMHPEILTEFSDIVGGKYTIDETDTLYYEPKAKNAKFNMAECSSGVRSLVVLSFYLHHQVDKGDLLIIDEPELNLHPENQRRIARLFSKLVNIGVKIFITTHSDYITSELSNLILLNSKDERIQKIVEENNYKKEELISHKRIKLYTAEPVGKDKVGSRGYTLNPAKIDDKVGIDAKIFNETIDEMNNIRDEIFFG